MEKLNAVAVFCGSRIGLHPEYQKAAIELGHLMGERGINLIYGGASVGLMGVLADAVLECNGKVIGVIPETLQEKEIAHSRLTELRVVSSMHERKSMMVDLSQGFIALPGGIGTLEEIFEVLTWAQLGLHQKPSGLLNTAGYYDGLMSFLTTMSNQGFLRDVFASKLLVEDRPVELLDGLSAAMEASFEDSSS